MKSVPKCSTGENVKSVCAQGFHWRRKRVVRPQVFYRRKLQARPQDDREDMTSIAQFYHHSDVKIQCKEIGW